MEPLHERLDRLSPTEQGLEESVLNIAVRISKEDARHARRRLALLAELQDLGYDEDDISGDPAPEFAFSEVTTVIEAAPDEEAMLQAVMIRLAKRGNYDSLIAELAISTLGPHDIDKLAEFLDSLSIDTPKHTISDDNGKALVECVACEDQLPPKDLILAACGHCYCGTCLDMVFNAAVLDESLYPPSCCENTPLPIEHAKRFLEPGMVETFNEKGVEFSTVDRTYCSDPTCSTFIPPSDIHGDAAVCDGCGKQTCVVCKAPTHPGDCPADEKLKALLEHAEKMRWQRCYNCLRVVQRLDVVDAALDSVTIAADVVKMETLALAPSRLEDKPTIIIYNYSFYRRPADGSRLRGPPVDEWQDRDEHGWPVAMDQAERQRILDEHVRAQAQLLQGGDFEGLGLDEGAGERAIRGPALELEVPPEDIQLAPGQHLHWRDRQQPEIGFLERLRRRNERIADLVHDNPHPQEGRPPLHVVRAGYEDYQNHIEARRHAELQAGVRLQYVERDWGYHPPELDADREEGVGENEENEPAENQVLTEDPEVPAITSIDLPGLPDPNVVIMRRLQDFHRYIQQNQVLRHILAHHDPRPDAPVVPPTATTTEDDPWKLADDPTACLHPEWWNHQGTATCSVCETDSRRTLHCPNCDMQVCRNCRNEGRVPYGFIQQPWTGEETFGGGVDPDVGS
ncbi:hypothetical protein D6D24_09124 [Aureobasidium pullulans]|uniref:IBR domain-containing protein n=1 Tax=Aureobasidium pullulans TaxID=5580 RepID=A0A4S8VBL1_AURPU|nr:hypothetical protein D6D24_09124 [Aureobasidium pullulans]